MATVYFTVPKKPITHPDFLVSDPDDSEGKRKKLFEFTFEMYIAALLSDPWWKGDEKTNENDSLARVDANFRIQDEMDRALGTKESPGDYVVELSEGDVGWLVQRGRTFQPAQQFAPFAPKILRFFRVLLTAQKTDPRLPKAETPA